MITSENFDSYDGLNGECPDDIEQYVYDSAIQILYDNGYSDYDFDIEAVRVIGSRMTDGLYRDDSDLDVLILYNGNIRDDDMFSMLHEYDLCWDNLIIDCFPERDRTLEHMLELDRKHQEEKC